MQELPTPCRAQLLAAALLAIACSAVPARSRAEVWPLPVAGTTASAPIKPPPPGVPANPIPMTAPAPAPRLINNAMPANGSLVLEVSSPMVGALTFSDSTGQVIEGTVRMIGRYAIWTPTRVLQPGSYTLALSAYAGNPGIAYAVMVGPEWMPARAAVSSMPTAELIDAPGMSRCCTGVLGFPNISTSCFQTQKQYAVRVTPRFTTTAPAADLSQLLFRVRIAAVTASGAAVAAGSYVPWSALEQPLVYFRQDSQYCFDLEAIEVTSARAYGYPDLMTRCVPHAALGELGPLPVMINAALVLDRAVCQVPPPGLEMSWCELNRAACTLPGVVGCENFGHLCDGEAPPVPAAVGGGTAGTRAVIPASAGAIVMLPGVAGMSAVLAGAPAAAGSGSFRGGQMDAAPRHTAFGCSCAVHAPRRSSAGMGWLLAFGTCCVWRARVRLRRRVYSTRNPHPSRG
jgi:hypothetical protein